MPRRISRIIQRLRHRKPKPGTAWPPFTLIATPNPEPDEPEWKRKIRAINELVERHKQKLHVESYGRRVDLQPEEKEHYVS